MTDTGNGTGGIKVNEILKNWDLLDVKTYSDILTSQLSRHDVVGTPQQLKTVISSSASKFNNYAFGPSNQIKHLPEMGENIVCTQEL